MINNYKSLCTLFYDLDKPTPPHDEYVFYLSYLKKYKNNILEPMCGSGRFLIPYLNQKYEIDAFDASSAMISVLKERLHKDHLYSNVQYCLFKDYVFTKKYNLIYIPSASLSLLYIREDFQATLNSIYDNLMTGGAFIFEVETPEILKKDKSDFKLIANHFISCNEEQKILGSFINNNYEDGVLTIACRYDLIRKDSIIKTEYEDIIVRLFTYEEILSMLKKIGFSVTIYVDFKKTLYIDNKKAKLLIIEAIKKH